MKQNSPSERLYNGIIKENPTFVLLLGMCPTLAITTSAVNGITQKGDHQIGGRQDHCGGKPHTNTIHS